MKSELPSGARWLAAGAGAMLGIYGAIAAVAWYRYGRVTAADEPERDTLPRSLHARL